MRTLIEQRHFGPSHGAALAAYLDGRHRAGYETQVMRTGGESRVDVYLAYHLTPGDTYPPDVSTVDHWQAGINVQGQGRFWGNRIEVYGRTQQDAEQLRDAVLKALNTLGRCNG